MGLPSLVVECDLCESWVMENERTYVFKLREGVRWQDIPPLNGRRLNADDIVFSYNRQRQRGWPNAVLLAGVQQLEAPRPDEVVITLSASDADFLVALADGHTKIVAREAVEVNGDLKNGPTIGSGPWILTETRPDVWHIFESNPDYFEEGLPLVSRIIMHIITDDATRDAAFEARFLDVNQMDPAVWEQFRRRHPDVPFLIARETGEGLEVALKTSAPPFDDLRVRRAVFQAMDPWEAIESIWRGYAYVSLGFPPVENSWLLEDKELKGFFGRPALARELLEEAAGDVPVRVSIKVGDFGEMHLAHARLIAQEMKAIGFEPTLEVVNQRVFGEEVWLGGDYQMFVGPMPPVSSPNGYLIPVLHGRGRWNTADFRDDDLDALIEAQSREFDPAERKALVQQIQRRVLENAYRVTPATPVSIWAWWPTVRYFHPNFAASEYFYWARVWLDD